MQACSGFKCPKTFELLENPRNVEGNDKATCCLLQARGWGGLGRARLSREVRARLIGIACERVGARQACTRVRCPKGQAPIHGRRGVDQDECCAKASFWVLGSSRSVSPVALHQLK